MAETLEGCVFTSTKSIDSVGVKKTKKDWFDIVFITLRLIGFGVLFGTTLIEFDWHSLIVILVLAIIGFSIFVHIGQLSGLLLITRKQRITIDHDTCQLTIKSGFLKKTTVTFSEIEHLEYALHSWHDHFFKSRAYRVEIRLVLKKRKKLALLTLNNESILDKGYHHIQRRLLKRAKLISKRIASTLRVPTVYSGMLRD